MVKAPDGYTLLHVAKNESVTTTGQRRECWTALSARSRLRVWDHDITPQPGISSELKALEWLALAPAMHGPVHVADVDAMLQRMAPAA